LIFTEQAGFFQGGDLTFNALVQTFKTTCRGGLEMLAFHRLDRLEMTDPQANIRHALEVPLLQQTKHTGELFFGLGLGCSCGNRCFGRGILFGGFGMFQRFGSRTCIRTDSVNSHFASPAFNDC
jgi:hypothetical protein